jgi:flavin reductase
MSAEAGKTAVAPDVEGDRAADPLREQFFEAMRKAASAVCVVATDGPNGRYGVTVSAFTSVSADPPSVLVCINSKNFVAPAIVGNGHFTVNILRETQSALSDMFAGRTAEQADRFSSASWHTLATGSPVLSEAAAAFDCTLAHHHTFGSHDVLIGTVKSAVASDKGALLYCNRNYYKLSTFDFTVACL